MKIEIPKKVVEGIKFKKYHGVFLVFINADEEKEFDRKVRYFGSLLKSKKTKMEVIKTSDRQTLVVNVK